MKKARKISKGIASRRNFLKKVGTTAAAAAGAAHLPSAYAATAPKRKVQYGMLIDTRRCIGCQACTVACKSEFDVPLGKNRAWVEYTEKGIYPFAQRTFLPRLCNHCTDPPCTRVCPVKATYKRRDGIVVIDKGMCIGCKYCIQACPYDARFLNPVTGTADKCDFCVHRVSQGLVPACVNTCMGRARIFGDVNDPHSEISRRIAANSVTVLRREMGTQPNVFYIGADHSDEHDEHYKEQFVTVETHRPRKERR
ncbi:MAG: 4Fe-4S dicluster domain-containing protein [Gammaproteobacteria bacterium]